MNQLHVGRGTSHGAMTVFPIWGTQGGKGRFSMNARHLEVAEHDSGPQVASLVVGNTGEQPVLVMEGQLFEGGWQHRMAVKPILIGVHQRIAVEVACVEAGRWSGAQRQHSRGRRATPYVAHATKQFDGDVQGEVWRRVDERTMGTVNETKSLVNHLDATGRVPRGAFPRHDGQIGLLIGIGGQPFVAEVFDSPSALRKQFDEIVNAAWVDALSLPAIATPGRRARRFIERAERVELSERRPAGIAEEQLGRTDKVDRSVVNWDGREIHQRISYLAHPMLVGV